ncbi:glycosyltransferase family 4 protein [Pseudorhodoferax sp.]|uniref:glycosyltransferase family 4 protein n=1 Tax=Pseudorhodoferax sp. TaxID=1993553 RepID=UPI0039E559FA
MRVAYVCADLGVPVYGRKGASVHVQEVLRALQRRGARITLFAARVDGAPPPDLQAVELVALPPAGKWPAEARARTALDGNAALAVLLRRHGPFDLVYERYSLWSHAGMAHARAAGCPGLLEVNAPLIEEQRTHRELALPEEAERVARSVFADATALAAVSPGVAAYLARWPQARGRVHVVANGVDAARFAQATPERAVLPPGQGPVVGFVGTLKPWHGLELLAEAFALLARQSHARLLVVGDGPGRAALTGDLARRGLLPHAALTGAVDPARVPGLLAAMDIAVAPYPALDGFYFSPLKIYEYMAAGLPVVASRVGHLDQVLSHGRDGWLVPPGDAAALATALAGLAADAPLRRRLGAAAQRRVRDGHGWDQVAARLLAIAGLCAAGSRW